MRFLRALFRVSLIKRSISAVIAIGLLTLLHHFFGERGFLLLSGLLVLSAAIEGEALFFFNTGVARWVRTMHTFLVLLIFSLGTLFPGALSFIFPCVSILWVLCTLRKDSEGSSQEHLNIVLRGLAAFLYLGVFPALGCSLLLHQENGLFWFCFLLTVVFAGDTLAFFIGRWWGKNRLNPSISPKKTLEGALGAVLGSILSALLVSLYFAPFPSLIMGILALVLSVAAQTGDFFESLLKRQAQQKDSGSFMPGHGGVLDRLDGVYFASPVLYTSLFFTDSLNWFF